MNNRSLRMIATICSYGGTYIATSPTEVEATFTDVNLCEDCESSLMNSGFYAELKEGTDTVLLVKQEDV